MFILKLETIVFFWGEDDWSGSTSE